MTGFARIEGTKDDYQWVWEAKSVNSKGLDVRFRLPRGFDQVETVLRHAVAKTISRGNLFILLNLQKPVTEPILKINRRLLDQLILLTEEYRESKYRINVEQLLMKSGVVEFLEDDELTINYVNSYKQLYMKQSYKQELAPIHWLFLFLGYNKPLMNGEIN